jgi:bacterioferritin-associated ferredoxin
MSTAAEPLVSSTRDEKHFEGARLVQLKPEVEPAVAIDHGVAEAPAAIPPPPPDPIDDLPLHHVIRLMRSPAPQHAANIATRSSAARRIQRTVGNRASQQIVMRSHVVQRQCACGGTCAKCQEVARQRSVPDQVQRTVQNPIQRSSAASAPATFDGIPASSGEQLDPATRRPMEAHFGADLKDVRVHTGSEAAKSAASLDALAYTSGRDIYFASGMYAPSSDAGRRLVAHEVAHVVQQSSGKEPTIAAKSSHGAKIGAPDDPLESEADRAAEAFMTGPLTDEDERKKHASSLPVQRFIQRQPTSGHLIQRDSGDKPATLDEAIRSGDSDKLGPFRPFPSITSHQLLSIVNIIVTEKWVSWSEESILEEAWSSYGKANSTSSLTAFDYSLWKSCANRGADVKNVFWLRELRSQFATDVRELARTNLEKNGKTIDAEAKRLGIGISGAASPEADAAVIEQQKQAVAIQEAKTALEKLSTIDVGYSEPPRTKQGSDNSKYGGTAPPGGLDDQLSRTRAPFDPVKPPAFPNEPGDGMAHYDEILAVHRKLAASVAETLNRNPALYALVALDSNDKLRRGGSDALAAPGQSPAEARKKIAEALSGVIANISKTRAAIDEQSLGFESMLPVQEKLYSSDKVYSQPFAHAAAKDLVIERSGDAAAGNELLSYAAMALILAVEIGSAGAATPLIGALIGLTASGAAAADSWNQWAKLDNASRSTPNDAGAIVHPEQAEQALQVALIATITALLDVYGAGKAARAASLARVAGLEAGLVAKKELTSLATRSLPEQKAILSRVIEEEGAVAAMRDSGRTADELIAIVGKETPAGESLAALTKGVSQTAMDDIANAIPQIGQKTVAEATSMVNKSIDMLGPAQTLQQAGGWSRIESAVAEDKGILNRLENWRKGLIDQTEKAISEAGGVEGATAARSFLAERTGLPVDAIETALGIIIMFAGELGGDTDVSSSAEGSGIRQPIDLELAASETATQHNVAPPIQRQVRKASPPLPLTEKQLDALSPQAFEEVIRSAIGSGHFASDGLPRMSILELKLNPQDHGVDGVGFRRRADVVDVYKFEFKQVTTGSAWVPELHSTSMGVQGGRGWSTGNFEKLMASDDPVALETLDTLRRNLRRYFGSQYSEELIMEAFGHELARAPLTIITRAHASLELLLPQLRGLARSMGKGMVRIIPVRGRP